MLLKVGDLILRVLWRPTLADASVCTDIVGNGILVLTSLLTGGIVAETRVSPVLVGSAHTEDGSAVLFFNSAFLFCNSASENIMSALFLIDTGSLISARSD